MDKLFGSKFIRNRFLSGVATLIILLILIRYFVLPTCNLSSPLNDVINSFIDKFVASVITAVIVGYYLYLLQVEEKKREIEFTESAHEIEKHLSQARLTTESWNFNGGLGRYSKFSTIPELSIISSKERRTISVKLIMINPFNKLLIEKYIAFRLSVENKNKINRWTELEVQSEILATIITCLYYKKINQFLNISVNIKDFFTLSRMDISSSLAVITREDPEIPSVLAKNGSYMYKHYAEEFHQVWRQSQNLVYAFPKTEKPSEDDIKKCIKALFPSEDVSEELLKSVCDKFKNPKSPFE